MELILETGAVEINRRIMQLKMYGSLNLSSEQQNLIHIYLVFLKKFKLILFVCKTMYVIKVIIFQDH